MPVENHPWTDRQLGRRRMRRPPPHYRRADAKGDAEGSPASVAALVSLGSASDAVRQSSGTLGNHRLIVKLIGIVSMREAGALREILCSSVTV